LSKEEKAKRRYKMEIIIIIIIIIAVTVISINTRIQSFLLFNKQWDFLPLG
jgi:uncharacterized integral membrane protein